MSFFSKKNSGGVKDFFKQNNEEVKEPEVENKTTQETIPKNNFNGQSDFEFIVGYAMVNCQNDKDRLFNTINFYRDNPKAVELNASVQREQLHDPAFIKGAYWLEPKQVKYLLSGKFKVPKEFK